MSNAREHAFGAAATIGITHALLESKDGEPLTLAPLASAFVAAAFGSGPDAFEPATHPNHRQFFHSVLFAVLVASGIKEIWKWNPDDPFLRIARWAGVVGGGAYLVHLAMDASTTKSIPWIGLK